jgi:hypothetical protein
MALGTIRAMSHNVAITPTFYPYTEALVHPRLDTQRRRLGKEVTG